MKWTHWDNQNDDAYIDQTKRNCCCARHLETVQGRGLTRHMCPWRSIQRFDRTCHLSRSWQASEAGASTFLSKQVRRTRQPLIKNNSLVLKRSQVCFKAISIVLSRATNSTGSFGLDSGPWRRIASRSFEYIQSLSSYISYSLWYIQVYT
jgi:hypothetical protein